MQRRRRVAGWGGSLSGHETEQASLIAPHQEPSRRERDEIEILVAIHVGDDQIANGRRVCENDWAPAIESQTNPRTAAFGHRIDLVQDAVLVKIGSG